MSAILFDFILLMDSCGGEVFLDYARRVCWDNRDHNGYTSFPAVIVRLNETLHDFGIPVFFYIDYGHPTSPNGIIRFCNGMEKTTSHTQAKQQCSSETTNNFLPPVNAGD